jgi:hypothetical protein
LDWQTRHKEGVNSAWGTAVNHSKTISHLTEGMTSFLTTKVSRFEEADQKGASSISNTADGFWKNFLKDLSPLMALLTGFPKVIVDGIIRTGRLINDRVVQPIYTFTKEIWERLFKDKENGAEKTDQKDTQQQLKCRMGVHFLLKILISNTSSEQICKNLT